MDLLANTDYYAMFEYLGSAGLNPARDVTFTLRPGPIAQVIDPLNEGKFDGFYAGPPGIFQARAAHLGHEIINLMMDKPWSDNYCCGIAATTSFVQKNPVATKRALRALLKASDETSSQPEAAARYVVDKGYRPGYDDVIASFKEMTHNQWRSLDHEASYRFHVKNFQAAGVIKNPVDQLVRTGVNLTFLDDLKKAKT